jgi:DNA-binding CsgD family transcriptional regulator
MFIAASAIAAVEAIYAASGEPARWPDALDAIAACFDALGTVLMMQMPGGAMTTITSPTLIAAGRDYEAGEWRNDFMVPRTIERGMMTDVCYTDRHLASPEEIATHPFYTGFRARHGLGSFIGAMVSPFGRLPVIVTMQGRARQPPYSDDDVTAFRRLAKHVERALVLTVRLLEAEAAQLALADALARLSCGVFLLDGAGAVVFGNAASQRALGGDLALRDERLDVRGAARDAFAEMMRRATEGIAAVETVRPILAEGPDGKRLLLHALPMRIDDVRQAAFVSTRACVMAIELDPSQPVDPAVLRDVLGLTLGEARLASSIGAGRSPRQAASDLNITEETARTILKRVFAKTGISKQSELAVLVTRLPTG